MSSRCKDLVTLLILILSAAFTPGCAGTHFRAVEDQFPGPVRFDPASVLAQEYWTGIVFGGVKIGFSHFRLEPAHEEPGQIDITSEAVFS